MSNRDIGPGGDYQRPNRRWLCGRDTSSCSLGPGRAGDCRGLAECRPLKRGDRWYCNRPPHQGDACEPGPQLDGRCGIQQPPCTPRRSAEGLRRQTVALALALALGVVMLGLGLGWW